MARHYRDEDLLHGNGKAEPHTAAPGWWKRSKSWQVQRRACYSGKNKAQRTRLQRGFFSMNRCERAGRFDPKAVV